MPISTALPRLADFRLRDRPRELTPDQEDSLLRQLGRRTIGGVAAFGNMLDLPGSMVRDVVGGLTTGRWGEYNPFDQLLTPFSHENRLSGRDLFRNLGIASHEDTWANAIGGFAGEVALDPLTYLTGGLTQAGKAARAMGLLDDVSRVATRTARAGIDDAAARAATKIGPREARLTTPLEDLMEVGGLEARQAAEGKLSDFAQARGLDPAALRQQTLGRPFGVGVPFTDITMPIHIPGDVKYARFMDKVGRGIKSLAPVRYMRGAFQSNLLGATSEIGQETAPFVSRMGEEGESGGRRIAAHIFAPLADSPMFSPVAMLRSGQSSTIQEARQLVRRRSNDAVQYLEDLADLPSDLMPHKTMFDEAKQALNKQFDWERSNGLGTSFLEDIIADASAGTGYWPRAVQGLPRSLLKRVMEGRAYSPTHPSQVGRKELLKNHLGGTAVLQDLSTDARISGRAAQAPDGKLSKAMLESIKRIIRSDYIDAGNRLRPDMTDAEVSQLARWVGTLDPRHAAEQVPIFDMNPFAQFTRRMEAGGRAVKTAQGLRQVVAEVADSIDSPQFSTPRSTVNLYDLTGQMFKPTAHSDDWWAKLAESIGETPRGADVMARAQSEATAAATSRLSQAAQAAGEVGEVTFKDVFSQIGVPADVAADIVRVMQGYRAPEAASELMGMYDVFLRTWKSYQTSWAPAFHVRNLLSGMAQSWFGHALDARAVKDAVKFQFGGTVEGSSQIPLLRRLGATTDEEATQLLREMAFEHKVSGYGTTFFDEMGAGAQASDFALPGKSPILSPPPVGSTLAQRLNPLDADMFTPLRWGRDVGNKTEAVIRTAPFLYLIRQGYSPEAAARRVKFLQVDYAAEAAADPYLRRIFPFWKFWKGSTQPVIDELLNRPGGRMAIAMKGVAKARTDEQVLPDYLAETTAVPLGMVGDNRRYITGFGMMFEDPTSLGIPVPYVGTGVREAMLETLSRATPPIKGVAEWATGQSFFQKGPLGGRAIEDLDPTIGRTLANVKDTIFGTKTGRVQPFGGAGVEYLASNIIGRPLTTLRTLTDPRKRANYGIGLAANLLTGVRISDITPAAQDAVIRESAQALMGELGARTFSRQFFPGELKESLSPHERMQVEQWEGMMKLMDKRMKARVEAAKKSR